MTSRILRPIFALSVMLFALPSHAGDSTISFRHLIVIGDSLSDRGNLLAATTALAEQFDQPPVANPANFGLENVTEPCFSGYVEPDPAGTVCANPDKYAFWDVEHPTTALHELIADAMHTAVLGCALVQGSGNPSAANRSPSQCALNVP